MHARISRIRIAWIGRGNRAGRIDAAGFAPVRVHSSGVLGRAELIVRPLPDVPRHVVEPEIGRWKAPDRRGAHKGIRADIAVRKSALPDVGHEAIIRRKTITPGETLSVMPIAGRVLPFRFGRQTLARPFAVRDGILPGDLYDGKIVLAFY